MDVVSYLLGKNSSSGGSEYNAKLDTSVKFSKNEGIKSIITEIKSLDTSSMTSTNNLFSECKNLLEIPPINTSNSTDMGYMFYVAYKIESIPLFDTSNVTDMNHMFYGCNALKDIPLFNTSKVKNMTSMIGNCSELTSESLDNILCMCIGATSYTGTKTLATLGLVNAPRYTTVIPTLPHYQDFINAGWTIGYN